MDNIHQPGHYTYRGIECKEVQKIMTRGLSTRRCITPGNLILLSMQDLSSRGHGLSCHVRQKDDGQKVHFVDLDFYDGNTLD